MGVWDTLIGLAATSLKDHPRREVLEELLKLRDAMVACQKTYDDYQAILRDGDYDAVMRARDELPTPEGVEFTQLYRPREAWGETVANLAETICEVDSVLTIFGPEVGESVRHFHTGEALDAEEGLRCTGMEVLESVDAGIDLQKVSLDSQCKEALKGLDEFIKQNFKVDEVFVAQKKIKVWPHPFRFCGEYWLTFD